MTAMIREAGHILEFIGRAFWHILPFFLLSIVIAALASQFSFRAKLAKFLNRKIAIAIIVATIIGAISPLCSCGVIPAIFALLQTGVPLAPIMSFWITSPLMSPEAFLLTWANLGLELAFARLAATLFMGIAAGFITLRLFPRNLHSSSWLRIELSTDPQGCGCQGQTEGNPRSGPTVKRMDWRKLRIDISRTTIFLGKWLAIAFFLEALIKFYLPTAWIKDLFGGQNPLAIVWAALAGIPLYVNNISAIPLVRGMLAAGMGKGATLAFLLAGPATSVPAMIAVYGIVKRRVFIVFLLLAFVLSVISGYVYEFVARIGGL